MIRTGIGGVLGGIVLYLVGFLFWGTPLAGIAFTHAGEADSAALQTALAQTLTPTGTGTYLIPDSATGNGTILFGTGPIATVHYNVGGFPVVDSATLIAKLVLAIVAGLLIAFALRGVKEARTRIESALLIALAITLYIDLGQPLVNHHGWGYFVYGFVADFLAFAAAGFVIARWFGQPTIRVSGIAPAKLN